MNQSLILRNNSYRDDVQGLRAIAVALVLFFHFGGKVEGGYLGVDMFFVISGFVIAQSTIREICETSKFSWRNFIRRRVRRLLPGATLVLAFSSVAALLLLSPFGPQQETSRMAIGAATYSTNFLLMSHGYFEIKAEANPLLHFWSLAVEEQFYFVWPFIVILFISLRRRLSTTVFMASVFVTLISTIAVSCLIFFLFIEKSTAIDQLSIFDHLEKRNITIENFGFYSPFSRAWEFLAGVLSAVLLFNNKKNDNDAWSRFTWIVGGVSVAFSIFAVQLLSAENSAIEIPSRALPTLLCVLGTFSLLFSGSNVRFSQKVLGVYSLRKVGDWSYSIYLWHWPLWAFTTRIWGPGWGLTLLITGASVFIGAIQYVLFESPVRNNKVWKRIPSTGMVASVVAGSIVVAISYSWLTPQIAFRLSGRSTGELALHVIERPCPNEMISIGNVESCVYTNAGSERTAVLVGDSMAKSLSEGFTFAAQNLGMRSLVYSLPGCPYLNEDSSIASNDACSSWRLDVFRAISSIQPDVLVIANLSSLYLELIGQTTSPQSAETIWTTDLVSTLNRSSAIADSILIVQPPPKFLSDVSNDISLVKASLLNENRTEVLSRRYVTNMIEVNAVGNSNSQIQVYNFGEIFCGEYSCSQVVNGQLMFEDVDHLTPQGSLLLTGPLEERIRKLTGS